MRDLESARSLLERGNYTCVLCRDGSTVADNRRGVRPLLELLESETDFHGFSAADKVVGAGAAYLYVLLDIKELYALVLSEPAKSVLERYGIAAHGEQTVPNIINRAGDGICPIEQAVAAATIVGIPVWANFALADLEYFEETRASAIGKRP